MPVTSKARIEANKRYNVKVYETISARARKEERVNDLLEAAAIRTGKSKQAYMLDAIRAQLERDGIGPEDLPAE